MGQHEGAVRCLEFSNTMRVAVSGKNNIRKLGFKFNNRIFKLIERFIHKNLLLFNSTTRFEFCTKYIESSTYIIISNSNTPSGIFKLNKKYQSL